MGEQLKKLSPQQAWEEWLSMPGKLTFEGTVKYTEDHLLQGKNLSKSNVHEAAVDRYIKDQSEGLQHYTWMSSTEADLVQKAGSTKQASWAASTYQGKQQLLVKVRIATWTVNAEEVTKQVAQNLKSQKKFSFVIRGKRYFKISKPTSMQAKHAVIVGNWNPVQAKAELYHYRSKPLPTHHAFLDKYLKWWCECNAKGKTIKILRPQAKS